MSEGSRALPPAHGSAGSSCHSSANVLYSFNEQNTCAVTTVSSHSSLTTSLYFGDHISSCRTLDNACVVPRLPKAPLPPQGGLWALQRLLLRWQTEILFLCTPRTPHFLSHGRIKQTVLFQVWEGRTASPEDMYQYQGDEGKKQEIEDIMTERCTATSKGVSKLQNVLSDNTKHLKLQVCCSAPTSSVLGFFTEQNCG